MIDLLAARTIMRSKFLIMLFWISISWSKIRPPDRHCQILMNKFDLMNKFNFDLMKKWILISWNSTSWSMPVYNSNLIYYQQFKKKLLKEGKMRIPSYHNATIRISNEIFQTSVFGLVSIHFLMFGRLMTSSVRAAKCFVPSRMFSPILSFRPDNKWATAMSAQVN